MITSSSKSPPSNLYVNPNLQALKPMSAAEEMEIKTAGESVKSSNPLYRAEIAEKTIRIFKDNHLLLEATPDPKTTSKINSITIDLINKPIIEIATDLDERLCKEKEEAKKKFDDLEIELVNLVEGTTLSNTAKRVACSGIGNISMLCIFEGIMCAFFQPAFSACGVFHLNCSDSWCLWAGTTFAGTPLAAGGGILCGELATKSVYMSLSQEQRDQYAALLRKIDNLKPSYKKFVKTNKIEFPYPRDRLYHFIYEDPAYLRGSCCYKDQGVLPERMFRIFNIGKKLSYERAFERQSETRVA